MANQDGWKPAERRLVVEQVDIQNPLPGGIATCISDFVKLDPSPSREWILACATNNGDVSLRKAMVLEGVPNRTQIVPIIRRIKRRTRVPDSLRMALGLIATRPKLTKIDVVQTHRPELGILAGVLFPRARKVVFVHTQSDGVTGSHSDSFWKFFASTYKRLTRINMWMADSIVIFNKHEYEKLPKKAQEKAKVAATWFNPRLHHNRGSEGNSHLRQRLLFVGRLEAPKRVELVLHALAELKRQGNGWTLDIIGNGSQRDELVRLAADLSLENDIRWLGIMSRENVATKMREPGRLLMLLSAFEGSPRVLIEALACGTPVVASVGADTEDLVIDRLSGMKVASIEPADIAKATVLASRIVCVEAKLRNYSAPAVIANLLD